MSTHDEYMTRRQARDLARRLARLERKTRSTAAAHADLRHSSVDGGVFKIKDADGNTAYELGTDPATGVTAPQYKSGPTPAQPSAPFVDVGGEVVKIQHSGLDVDENPAPADFRRAQIHVSQDEVFEPSLSSLAGYLEEADGSFTHRLPGGEWWVGIVWETLSGKISVMSGTVLADIPPLVDAQDIEDTLAEAEQIISDAVAEAQTQLDELRDRLDNFEGFDPADLIAEINRVTEDLADARQEAAGLVSDLADRVDDIKIPDVTGFITQAEVDAAATAAETAAKEHADLVAQGAKDEAIAEAETKANAAREAAEQAAKAYTDQQDIETLEAAAEDATAKANAAQSAAEAEAERLAKAEAQAAEAEAIRVAAADALAQAEAARDAAIASASDDAEAKANAAREAAETYAEAEAQAKADAAQAEAIRQAKEDATAKADAAKDAAEQAAKDYADQQDAQVKIDAALDAQEKADAVAAQAREELSALEIGSRNYFLNSSATPPFTGGTLNNNNSRVSFLEQGYEDGVFYVTGHSYENPDVLYISTYTNPTWERDAENGYEHYSEHFYPLPSHFAQSMEVMCYEPITIRMGSDRDSEITLEPGVWTRLTTVRDSIGARPLGVTVSDSEAPVGTRVYMRHWKLEKGNKATDWSPAPEDLQARIDAAQARADEAHEDAGAAWTQADAAMTLAGEAKTDAIEEAGRLATAAREAAEAEAGRLAKAEAQAAQSAAEANAAADALAKAEAARDAAIDSASDDATAKANAAKTAAETAAAADAKAKADAAQAEAIRQAELDATAKADAAQAAAEQAAKEHADNLPKMLGGTGGPVGTAPNGSVWFRRDSNNTVIGRWERIGGSWVQQEVSGQLIDNLEAGKITALHTEFAESVVGKLWTQLAIVDRLIATSAWIGGAMIGEDAVEAKHITASESLSAKVAEFLKLSVADLIAGSAEIDEAVVEKFWTAFAVIDRLRAAEAWVTGDLVVGETIHTRHLRVTADMVGEFASFLHLVTDRMDVNKLWADQTWQAAGHFGSSSADQSTLVDGTGLRITKHDHENETSTDIVRLGGEGIGLTFFDEETGEVTGSQSPEGDASYRDVSVDRLTIGGRLLLPETDPAGFWDGNLWDSQPKGLVCFHEVDMQGVSVNHTHYGFIEVSHHVKANRRYRVAVNNMRFAGSNPYWGFFRYTIGDNPPAPHTESPELARWYIRSSSSAVGVGSTHTFTPPQDGLLRVLASVATTEPNIVFANLNGWNDIQMTLEDLGPSRPYTGMARNAGHGGTGTVRDPRPLAGGITTAWDMTWFQNYSHGGTRKRTNNNSTAGYASYGIAQGARQDTAFSEGIWASLFGFGTSTESTNPDDIGVTLAAATNGADILSMYLEVTNHLAWNNAGYTNYNLYWHDHPRLAATPAQHTTRGVLRDGTGSRYQVGSRRRIPLPVSVLGTPAKNGELSGFAVNTGATASTWAGLLAWGDQRPRLVINYQR